MKNVFTLFLLIVLLSCNKDKRKFTITDFNNSRIDTLSPYKYKIPDYTMYRIKVKGYTNDTIKIRHKGGADINLSGSIDTLITSDYYGEYDLIPEFLPYKATKGKVEIQYNL